MDAGALVAEFALIGAAVYAGFKKAVVYCLGAIAGAALVLSEALSELEKMAH